jgi:O-antigen/teichoic acid export membrane protein
LHGTPPLRTTGVVWPLTLELLRMDPVRKSIMLSSLDSWANVAFQLCSTVVIARILTPEETGIFAVAAVFAALASSFRDFGVGEYLIQEKELTPDAIRAAFTVNIAVSWLMAALLMLLAPVAAEFYRSPGITNVIRVQAFNFLLIPFGAVTMAWFRREMNFVPILIAGLVGNSTSFVVSVGLATHGFGYMSLAWASLAGVIVTVATSLWFRPATFPRWPGFTGIRRVVDFGKFASGIYIFGQLGKGAPEMIIGRAQDMAAVGMFSRAYGLIEIFNRLVLKAVLPVCLPYFARSVRDEGTPLKGLLRATAYLTAIGWPFLAFVCAAAYSAVRLLYGAQWMHAIALAQVLCAAAAVELIYCTAKEAMLSLGKAKESNELQMLIQGMRILGLLAVVPFGLTGACWGLLAAAVLGALASHLYLRRVIGLRLSDMLMAVWRSAAVTLVSVLPLFLWTQWMPFSEDNYIRLGAAGAAVVAILWLFSMRWFAHPLWTEMQPAAAAALQKLRRKT